MSQINITILVSASWRDRYAQVVERCRLAGMLVERELVTVGVIAGTIDEDCVGALARIEGVGAIEPERLNRGFTASKKAE